MLGRDLGWGVRFYASRCQRICGLAGDRCYRPARSAVGDAGADDCRRVGGRSLFHHLLQQPSRRRPDRRGPDTSGVKAHRRLRSLQPMQCHAAAGLGTRQRNRGATDAKQTSACRLSGAFNPARRRSFQSKAFPRPSFENVTPRRGSCRAFPHRFCKDSCHVSLARAVRCRFACHFRTDTSLRAKLSRLGRRRAAHHRRPGSK